MSDVVIRCRVVPTAAAAVAVLSQVSQVAEKHDVARRGPDEVAASFVLLMVDDHALELSRYAHRFLRNSPSLVDVNLIRRTGFRLRSSGGVVFVVRGLRRRPRDVR